MSKKRRGAQTPPRTKSETNSTDPILEPQRPLKPVTMPPWLSPVSDQHPTLWWEYIPLLAIVIIVLGLAFFFFGKDIKGVFTNIASAWSN